MKIGPLNRWAVVGVVLAVLLVNLQLATSQSQQRVQSTQLTVQRPVEANQLSEWDSQLAEARKVAAELTSSGFAEYGERLDNDLDELDEALKAYVRASERLRHKDRALSETMEFLALQNAMQMQSRQYQTISNALRAAHDVKQSTIRNMK
jgi:hypothetical protein